MIDYKIKVDWKPTLAWLERIKAGTGDARPLWAAMIPRIRTFVKDEFAGGNPNKWQSLSPRYRHWKATHGYPHWIGVLTGKMRDAAGPGANIQLKPRVLIWGLDQNKTRAKNGASYSGYFHSGTRKMPARPIFRSTRLRVDTMLRKDLNDMKSGDPRMSFTFAWLSKSLEPYRKR